MSVPSDQPAELELERLLSAGVSLGAAATLALGVALDRLNLPIDRIPHGTERGYQRHRYLQVEQCVACQVAHGIHNNGKRSAARAARRRSA